jgi:exosortase
MSLKNKLIWIPWAFYSFMVIQSVAANTLYDPNFGKSDDPLLFATIIAVLWMEKNALIASFVEEKSGYLWYGSALFFLGIIIYMLGRLFPVMTFEVWGLFIMASALVMTFSSPSYIRSAAFIGIAGTILVVLGKLAPEALSSRLAVIIASMTSKVIDSTLFPIVANGVVLYFGPYSAEVVHACSGMNSIFSLLALSLIYLREGVQRKWWHLAIMVSLVIPVAVITNIFRVTILVLSTWYVSEQFAQGFFHDFAGIIVFVLALILLALIDNLLLWIAGGKVNKDTKITSSVK